MLRRLLNVLAILSLVLFTATVWVAYNGVWYPLQGPSVLPDSPFPTPGERVWYAWMTDEDSMQLSLSIYSEKGGPDPSDWTSTQQDIIVIPLGLVALISLILPSVWILEIMIRASRARRNRLANYTGSGFPV